MDRQLVLPFMLFMHVLDDFVLQPVILNQLKQKSWWAQNAPDIKYSRDYIAALLAHAFSWSFAILIPTAIYWQFYPPARFYIILFANMAVHGMIDHLKANCRMLNLIQDQSLHIVQIIVACVILIWM